jgi:hypothetical protein
MKKTNTSSFLIGVLITLTITSFAQATEVTLDEYGSAGERPVNKVMDCQGQKISFIRSTNPPPKLNIGGTNVSLTGSCYSSMSCIVYKNNPAVLVVDQPACGGNGMPESYLLFDIVTKKQTRLSYQAAKRAKIIN